MVVQTKWRGRVARKWLHRERKRWKKAARSLHPEVFDNWFDNADRYVHDHEVSVCTRQTAARPLCSHSTRCAQEAEWKWPYEQSEEWRGNIHAAYLAGKEVR